MSDQIASRLKERLDVLHNEYRAGQEQLTQIDARRAELQSTMLRIAGAIQVLEEVISEQANNDNK